MDKESIAEQLNEDFKEEQGFMAWIKANKESLLLAGLSITALIVTILGIKNKNAIAELWNSLKKELEKGSLYSAKWFENASREEKLAARNRIWQDYANPELEQGFRNQCKKLLDIIDADIEKRSRNGIEYQYPAYSANGPYLLSDD